MHLLEVVTDKALMQPTPCGPGRHFEPEQIEKAATMEIHGSDFNEPGPDYCVFTLKDQVGQEIASRRIEGY